MRLVAEAGIVLRQIGQEFRGRCPFHQDDTPSFFVNPIKQVFHCFGCGAKGNALTFGQRIRGGTKQPHLINSVAAHNDTEAIEFIVNLYHEALWKNNAALDYLASRGIGNEQLLKRYRVGFSEGKLCQIVKRGNPMWDTLRAHGYITKKDRELMAGFVVFPISDFSESVTQMYGRRLRPRSESNNHLYLGVPRRGIWNWKGAQEIEGYDDPVVICESVIDAISCVATAMPGAIALYGTNGFTRDHFDLLALLRPERVVMLMDADNFGHMAERIILEKIKPLKLNVTLGRIEGAKDPNEFLTKYGPVALWHLIANAKA